MKGGGAGGKDSQLCNGDVTEKKTSVDNFHEMSHSVYKRIWSGKKNNWRDFKKERILK